VEIVGHTDARGSKPYNRNLAQRRADAVKQILIEKFEVPEAKVMVEADGASGLPNGANPLTWAAMMAIRRLLQNCPMLPEEIGRLVGAYQQTLRTLRLKDRRDPITEMVAEKVFEIGQTGAGDAAEISRLAIKAL
jgi:hypothetical protein